MSAKQATELIKLLVSARDGQLKMQDRGVPPGPRHELMLHCPMVLSLQGSLAAATVCSYDSMTK
jgi:hypothetical protein